MSTAAVVAQEPVKETPAAEQKKPDIQSLLRPNVIVKDNNGNPISQTNPQPLPEKKETKKEEKQPTEQELNFKNLREKSEGLEKTLKEREETLKKHEEEAQKLRMEIEDYKKRPDPKTYEEQIKKITEERDTYSKQLSVAALSRHPDFVRKYNDSIQAQVGQMTGMAKALGIEQAEINSAIARWDTGKFAEWHDQMDRPSQIRFSGYWQKAETLDGERIAELEHADRTWNDMQKQQQDEFGKQQTAHVEALKRETAAVLAEINESQQIVKDSPELRAELEGLLQGATRTHADASRHLTTRQVMTNLAQAHVLARHFQRVEAENKELQTKLEEAQKTLGERDEFIKKAYGSIPTPGATSQKPAEGDKKTLLGKLVNPTVVVRG